MTPDQNNYRERLYRNYATLVMRSANTFDRDTANRWGKAYDYYLRDWLPANRDAAVLDVACGAGRLLHFFKARGYTNLTGVDISPEQVALARQVIPNIIQSDVLAFLESQPNRFDIITGLDIIEHLEKPVVVRFFDACHLALKPQGRLILETVNADSPMALPILYGDFTHESCFAAQTLVSLMTMTGFTQIQTRETGPIPYGYSISSTLRYMAWRVQRLSRRISNAIETGTTGSEVLTRVMAASGVK